jgi:hypothetical protein
MKAGAPRLNVVDMLARAQDAQRHNRTKFSFIAKPTQDLFQAFDVLIAAGVLTKVGGLGPVRWGVRRFECTLRYLEGSRLTSLKSTPHRACSYAEVGRRAREGSGAVLLL